MVSNNYLIINKKAQPFSEMRMAGRTAVFLNEDGKVLDFGVLPLDDSIYTVLTCDEVRMVMMVIEGAGSKGGSAGSGGSAASSKVEAVIWKEDDAYDSCVAAIRRTYDGRLSKQDLKINSYAWSIAKKLDDGVRIKVTDALDTTNMLVCPECGMLNPKGSQYCLECGAEI